VGQVEPAEKTHRLAVRKCSEENHVLATTEIRDSASPGGAYVVLGYSNPLRMSLRGSS